MLETSENARAVNRTIIFKPGIPAYDFPFYMHTAGYVVAQNGFYTTRSGRRQAWLVYTVSGVGRLTWREETVFLHPGSVALIRCEDWQDYRTASRDYWIHHYIHFDGSGLKAYSPFLLDRLRAVYPANLDVFNEGFALLQKDVLKNDPVSNSRASLMINSFLNEMLIACSDLSGQDFSGPGSALLPAIEYIQDHFAEPVRVETLCNLCHLSKYHFIRSFKQATGASPYQYILQYRINQAKRLLAETQQPIGSVAEQVGFLSAHNFAAQFKRHATISPAAYRHATHKRVYKSDPNAPDFDGA